MRGTCYENLRRSLGVLRGVGDGDQGEGGDPLPLQYFYFVTAFVTPLQTCWACLRVNFGGYFEW